MSLLSRSGAALVTVLVGLVLASPASADPPTITHYVDETAPGERIDLSAFSPAMDCGTTHVELSYRDVVTMRVFHHRGELVRVVRFHKGMGTLWLIDDATGDVLATETGSSPSTETFDLRDMTYTVVGSLLHNTVPGQGRVAHVSGRITYRLLSFDASALERPIELVPDLGDQPQVLRASAKSMGGLLDVDWCSILEDQI